MRKILATDFGIFLRLQNIGRDSDSLLHSSHHWAQLANYLVLYDQIVIPTGNYQILPVLRLMLGEEVFDELLNSKAIVFARLDQWFGYVGGGVGLSLFSVKPGENNTSQNLGLGYFQPVDEAIDTALRRTNPPTGEARKRALTTLVAESTLELPTIELFEEARAEAYRDFAESPLLRDFLSVQNVGRPLTNLEGVRADQVVIFNPHVPPEPTDSREIHALQRVAFENFILAVGGKSGVTELASDKATLSVMLAKAQRYNVPVTGTKAFTRLQSLHGVPDIGSAFASKALTPRQVLELRNSRHAIALREWFAKKPAEGDDDAVRRYLADLKQPSGVERLPVKALRFGITTSWGAIEPFSGSLAAAVDQFLLSKWFPHASPTLFMLQSQRLLEESAKHKTKNPIGRNDPCHCGSGLKYKKCHGHVD